MCARRFGAAGSNDANNKEGGRLLLAEVANSTADANTTSSMLSPAEIAARFEQSTFWFSAVFFSACVIHVPLLILIPRCLSPKIAAKLCKTLFAHTKLQTQVVGFAIYALALNSAACIAGAGAVASETVAGSVVVLLFCFVYIGALLYLLRDIIEERGLLYIGESVVWMAREEDVAAESGSDYHDAVAVPGGGASSSSSRCSSCIPSDLADALSRYGDHVTPFREERYWYCGINLVTSVLTAIVIGAGEGESTTPQQVALFAIYTALLASVMWWRPHISMFLNVTAAVAALNRIGAIVGTALAQSADPGVRGAGETVAIVFAAAAIMLQVVKAVKAVAGLLLARLRGNASGASNAVAPDQEGDLKRCD